MTPRLTCLYKKCSNRLASFVGYARNDRCPNCKHTLEMTLD